MDFNFNENATFKSILKSKQYLIINRTSNEILESTNYKLVFTNLKSMIQNNSFRGSKVILIKEEVLSLINNLDTNKTNALFSNINFATSEIIEINEHFEIVDYLDQGLPKTTIEIRPYFIELSKNNYVVFSLLESSINSFINGSDFPESEFLTISDKKKHLEKKNISQLNPLLEEYRERLKDQHVYCKFFIPKSLLASLHNDLGSTEDLKKFIVNNSHILNNKCEDKFREDLRIYLKENLNVSVIIKEYILSSYKRLDIFMADEFGINFYLIEVKWVGESIHNKGKQIGTCYSEKNINPDAFYQTLNYLDELDAKKENITRAFLVVFDARKDDLPDTGANLEISNFNAIQAKQYRKFDKINDFRVKNIHPS